MKFDHFQDEWLRDEPNERFVPKGFGDRPYNIFETGGTTGLPKQRIGWDDYKHDYEMFSHTLRDESFPKGGNWIMVGPTGPRRLRLAVEHPEQVRSVTLIEPVFFAVAKTDAPEVARDHIAVTAGFGTALAAQDYQTAAIEFTAIWGAGMRTGISL